MKSRLAQLDDFGGRGATPKIAQILFLRDFDC